MENFGFFPWRLKKLLNGPWNVPVTQQRSVGLNAYWKVTEKCLKSRFQLTFREHSVNIQKCFSWLIGEFSSCEEWKDRQKEILILIFLFSHILVFLELYLNQRYIFKKEEAWPNTVVNYLVYRIFICWSECNGQSFHYDLSHEKKAIFSIFVYSC